MQGSIPCRHQAGRQFYIKENIMLWTFKGKHEGKDVNDVPLDYIQWAADSSKNPEAKAMAVKILAYRNGGNGNAPSSNNSQSPGTVGVGMRAKALELAIMMDNKNPWPYIKATLDYVQTGQFPNLVSMLGEESSETTDASKKDPFLSDLNDDEIPF